MRTIMNRKVRVYVPSECVIEISHVTNRLAKKFGGVTVYKTESACVNDEGELIKEDVTVIEAWYKEKEHLLVFTHMMGLALHVKERCKQDCVAMEVEGEMTLV